MGPKLQSAVDELEVFYKICNELFMTWSVYRAMFDDNMEKYLFEECPGLTSLKFMSFCMIESILMSISKLHDPEQMKGGYNLCLDYVINRMPLADETRSRLRELKDEMQLLADKLIPARHKVLAHHDLQIALAGVSLGGFDKDSEIKYFSNLQLFVDNAFVELTGRPRPFNSSMGGDAKDLWSVLTKGWRSMTPSCGG